MSDDRHTILWALRDGGAEDPDPIGVLEQLLDMEPRAKMVLADMLNGFIAYEPEKWQDALYFKG